MKNIIITFLVITSVALAEEITYVNPVDGIAYRAKWKTYSPKEGVKKPSDRLVEMKNTRLLSTQKDFADNLSVKELAEFIKATQNNIEKSIDTPTEGFELLVDTKITKDKDPEFEMASQGNVSKELLQKIHDGLQKMKGFRSKKADLKYQVHYIVKKKG